MSDIHNKTRGEAFLRVQQARTSSLFEATDDYIDGLREFVSHWLDEVTAEIQARTNGRLDATSRESMATKWAGESCLLDGKPAKIIGAKNLFATVASLESALKIEFCWEVVDRIMSEQGVQRGKFRS